MPARRGRRYRSSLPGPSMKRVPHRSRVTARTTRPRARWGRSASALRAILIGIVVALVGPIVVVVAVAPQVRAVEDHAHDPPLHGLDLAHHPPAPLVRAVEDHAHDPPLHGLDLVPPPPEHVVRGLADPDHEDHAVTLRGE